MKVFVLSRVGTVRESQGQKHLLHHSQGKSEKVRDNVRKSWTELKWSGTILEKWDYVEFWTSVSEISVSLQLISLYS